VLHFIIKKLAKDKQNLAMITANISAVGRCLVRQPRRSFSSSSSSKSSSSTFERSAKLVKNTDHTNQYLDKIRSETVDPTLQLKTIEDELCGAIGKALGRQGEKVLFALTEMNEERIKYKECIQRQQLHQAVEYANRHNEARKRALKARWELLVHRQAVGFTTDNHSVVHATFPIQDALPIDLAAVKESLLGVDNSSRARVINSKQKSDDTAQWQKFGDQLAWWQRVGRWK
jgi:hypothetical protein